MSEDGAEGYTKRQLRGVDYLQYNEKVPLETHITRMGHDYLYDLHAKAKNPPEIDNVAFTRSGIGAMVVYQDIDKFLISNKSSGRRLNLAAITPPNWSQKMIDLTSPGYMAPEVHQAFHQYQVIDVPRKECVISRGVAAREKADTDIAVKAGLWNTLVARFVEEIGEPANQQGFDSLRNTVMQRRQQIFDALSGKLSSDPAQIALTNFKS